jgi:hypothetical protein
MLNLGYLGATLNYWQALATGPSSSTWTAGSIFLARIDCVPGATANGYVSFPWLHHASMANSYIGLYNSFGTSPESPATCPPLGRVPWIMERDRVARC